MVVVGCSLGIALGFELLVWGLLSWREASRTGERQIWVWRRGQRSILRYFCFILRVGRIPGKWTGDFQNSGQKDMTHSSCA